MKEFNLAYAIAAILLCFCAETASSYDGEMRKYPVANRGVLGVHKPVSWVDRFSATSMPPTIRLSPKEGAIFECYLTLIPKADPNAPIPSDGKMQEAVQKMIELIKTQALESDIEIKDIHGSVDHGFYFSMTDRAPKKGEYRYLTQGVIQAGTLSILVTLMSNDESGVIERDTLEVLQSLVFDESRAAIDAAAQAGRPDALQIVSNENDYLLAVPVSRIALRIPKGKLNQESNPRGGAANSPRYFYLVDHSTPLIISGWFEPAKLYKGVRKTWEGEVSEWKKNNIPLPMNESFGKVGPWDVIYYDVAKSDPTPTHLRAYLVQDGTWIDLHLSIGSSTSDEHSRDRLTELLRSIAVVEASGQ
jgi:hypothetical protein